MAARVVWQVNFLTKHSDQVIAAKRHNSIEADVFGVMPFEVLTSGAEDAALVTERARHRGLYRADARNSCMKAMDMLPSPTPLATRLIEP
jgi:hypothetical protein